MTKPEIDAEGLADLRSRIATGDPTRVRMDELLAVVDALAATRTSEAAEPVAFQQRVAPWMDVCFGPEISGDRLERGDRFLEEALELLQSGGYPRERIAALTDYVFDRPQGEINQEVGGVMVTLAAYCLAFGLDMHAAGETELARIWTKVEKIRAKQAAKPTGSALPVAAPHPSPVSEEVNRSQAIQDVLAERTRQVEVEGWTPEHDDDHSNGELASAAGVYALAAGNNDYRWALKGLPGNDYLEAALKLWPWNKSWFKPKDRRRDLVKAGALILAEIERLDRAALASLRSPKP